jgi:hypothetical protein
VWVDQRGRCQRAASLHREVEDDWKLGWANLACVELLLGCLRGEKWTGELGWVSNHFFSVSLLKFYSQTLLHFF